MEPKPTALATLTKYIKDNYAWFIEHSPNDGVVPKIFEQATSLLEQERRERINCILQGLKWFNVDITHPENIKIAEKIFNTHFKQ